MDKRRYFAGKLKPGTRKFERCVRKYGPLTEKAVETPVEEVVEVVEEAEKPVEEVIEAVEEVETPKKAKKKAKRTTKKKTEE
jgi:hypothetical protein